MDITKIGAKIKSLRLRYGLTQEELADRAELSKGFISQLERDQTSPSIVTLVDILECLGTTPGEFFTETADEKIVFSEADMFEKVDENSSILWLIPNAQKNQLEPILFTLAPGASSEPDEPHEGEEFGYVLSGTVTIVIGNRSMKAKKGEAFYYTPNSEHYIKTNGKSGAVFLWISTPPNF